MICAGVGFGSDKGGRALRADQVPMSFLVRVSEMVCIATLVPACGSSAVDDAIGEDPDVVVFNQQDRFAIDGLNDRNSAGPLHYVELYGSFPGAGPLTARVICNGYAVPNAKVEYASSGQVNVSFPEQNTGSTCTFSLTRSDGLTTPNFGPVALHPPIMQIVGANKATPAGNRNYYELYGRFPDAGRLQSIVWCDGGPVASRIEYQSTGQVNISFPGVPRQCSFALARTTDGRQSPVYGPVTVVGPPR